MENGEPRSKRFGANFARACFNTDPGGSVMLEPRDILIQTIGNELAVALNGGPNVKLGELVERALNALTIRGYSIVPSNQVGRNDDQS